jgi:predicted O-linked N-acetylglucosamine transferase (SPINDLY family)
MKSKKGKVVCIKGLLSDSFRYHQIGRLNEAEQLYWHILEINFHHADSLNLLGVIAYKTGRLELAVDLIYRAIRLNVEDASYYSNLGLALQAQARLDAAVACYGRALSLKPDYLVAYTNLGLALQNKGRMDRAVACYRRAIELDQDSAQLHCDLGNVFKEQGRRDIAVICYRRALSFEPDYAKATNNLGVALWEQGRADEVVACYQRAVTVNPHYLAAHTNLGNMLQDSGRFDESVACYRGIPELEPDYYDAHNNLGSALQRQGSLDEAGRCYLKAIELKEDFDAADSNLGNVFKDQGRLSEAIGCYRKALDLKPDFANAHSNLLTSLNYMARYSSADVFAQARSYAQYVERSILSRGFLNVPDLHRRLRIWYVSADFRSHPVGYFLSRVLAAHDPVNFEVICYSNSARADAVTTRLRELVDGWRSIVGASDADAARLIEGDGIDILIDFSGHTAGNRLSLFAPKPAPIQVTWLGYFGTTGLSTIDYIIADRLVVPPGVEVYFTEKVWCLPECYLCYSPHPLEIPVGPFPASVNGIVTFGCFNNRSKISAETVAVWAAVLKQVKGSRLFLKTKSLADADCRIELFAEFARHGIAGDSLVLERHSPLAEALAAYGRVDIALDPFPFGGGTTTAETLWMGVPLVTLRGERLVGRISESILATMGLNDWVEEDTEHYVEIARRLAANLSDLAGLRSDLRRRFEHSSFCDGPLFARSLEAAFRSMWTVWCAATETALDFQTVAHKRET